MNLNMNEGQGQSKVLYLGPVYHVKILVLKYLSDLYK